MNLANMVKKHHVVVILLGIFVLYFYYMSQKNKSGSEKMSKNSNAAYKNGSANQGRADVQPSEPLGQNEVYSAVGSQPQTVGLPSSCKNANNPADLLPKDNNSQWAQLNPAGKGDLSNINLLKAGYHIGIDTVGQSLRNSNQQIRSEPANPQVNTGIWNQSTITPDFMRPPLEIGQGTQ